MNQRQRKYVMKRITAIYEQRVKEYEESLVNNLKVEPLTVGVLLDGIKDGSIGVKHANDDIARQYWNLSDLFDLVRFDEVVARYGTRPMVDEFDNKLKKEIERIEDHLYLGDAADALEMISKFESFEPK